eukprot:403339697
MGNSNKKKASDKSFELEGNLQHGKRQNLEIPSSYDQNRSKSVGGARLQQQIPNANNQKVQINPQQQQQQFQQMGAVPQGGYDPWQENNQPGLANINGIYVPIVIAADQQQNQQQPNNNRQQQQLQHVQNNNRYAQPLQQQQQQQRSNNNQQPINVNQSSNNYQQSNGRLRRQLNSGYGSEIDSQDDDYQDILNEAIIQSIFEQDQNEEEEKMLREVMKLSSLEHQKQNGQISLDGLKKRNRQQQNGGAEVNGFQQIAQAQKNNANLNGSLKQPQNQNVNLPPVEIGGKKQLPQIGSKKQNQQQVRSSIAMNDPQAQQDLQKLSQFKVDPNLEQEELRRKKQKDLEEQKFLELITPNAVDNIQMDEEQKILDQSDLNINQSLNKSKSPLQISNIKDQSFVNQSPIKRKQSPQLNDDREKIRKQQNQDIKNLLNKKNPFDDDSPNKKPGDEFDDLMEDSLDLNDFGSNNNNSKIVNGSSMMSPIKAQNNSNMAKNSDMKSKKLEDLFGIESKNKSNNKSNIMIQEQQQYSNQSSSIKNQPIRESEDDFDKLIGHIEGSRAVNNLNKKEDDSNSKYKQNSNQQQRDPDEFSDKADDDFF